MGHGPCTGVSLHLLSRRASITDHVQHAQIEETEEIMLDEMD